MSNRRGRTLAFHSLSPRHSHFHPRADAASANDGNGGLSTGVIVGIAGGCVGGVVLGFVLWQLFRKLFRPRANPLPPVQPLAHRRERQLADFHGTLDYRKSRATAAWSDTALLRASSTAASTSDASLLTTKEQLYPPQDASYYLTPEPSDGVLSAYDEGEVSPNEASLLAPPTRPFLSNRSSGSSSGPASSRSASSLEILDESVDAASAAQTPSPSDTSCQPSNSSHQRHSRPHSRSRPQSMWSLGSAYTAGNVGNTIRGAPHNRNSRIQVVLPAPLAPELYPSASENEDVRRSRRFTMVGDSDDHLAHHRQRTISDAWTSQDAGPSTPGYRSDDDVTRQRMASSSPASGQRRHSRMGSSPSARSSVSPHYSDHLPPVPPIPHNQHRGASPLRRSMQAADDGGPNEPIRGRERPSGKLRKQSSRSASRSRSQARGRGNLPSSAPDPVPSL